MSPIINPWKAFLNTNGYLLTGRLHFPREHVGEAITTPDGRTYTVFREGRVDPLPGQPTEAGATFVVRFHTRMPARLNKLFSFLPMPFCMGFPGFRTKFWMIDEQTGDFQGMYEWDTLQDAENYSRSAALAFMTNRSVPGSVSFQIFPCERADLIPGAVSLAVAN